GQAPEATNSGRAGKPSVRVRPLAGPASLPRNGARPRRRKTTPKQCSNVRHEPYHRVTVVCSANTKKAALQAVSGHKGDGGPGRRAKAFTLFQVWATASSFGSHDTRDVRVYQQ